MPPRRLSRGQQTEFSSSMGTGSEGIMGPVRCASLESNTHPSCCRGWGQEADSRGGGGPEDSRDGQASTWGKLPAGGHHRGVI